MIQPLWTSTKESTPQVRASRSRRPVSLDPWVPEQSRSAKPRRSTCRAPDLDGSELCQWTQWNWPAPGPAWKRLSPPLSIWRASGKVQNETAESLRTVSASVWCSPRGILLRWWRPPRGASAFERWDALRTDEGGRNGGQRRCPTSAPAHRLWSAASTSVTTTGSFS